MIETYNHTFYLFLVKYNLFYFSQDDINFSVWMNE